MLKSKYQWNVLVPGIVPNQDIYSHILRNRGIEDAERFFSMGEESLNDPYLFDGMERAVARVHKAIAEEEKILIFGDYDCDGISAISVLFRALVRMNARVSYDLPDRFQDGYGLNMRSVQKIIDQKIGLVITVDNGITCMDEVKYLRDAGIDTIITDHHEVKDALPKAFQILHTKLSPGYPFKEIAGVMVAYKFASAIANDPLRDLYDLVMIGTIADLVPLRQENQAIVNLGIQQLKQTTNLGLKKLLEYSHLDLINETAIAFKIAPKINSSGRLGKALQAVKLLVSESEQEVSELIYQIEVNHASRKDLTNEAVQTCEALVDHHDDVIVVASANLHEGVIGICAQKLAEKHQKSTVVITFDETGLGKGSMRSFGSDNILEMLENHKDLLIRFGGHAQAAGLQLTYENIDRLRKALNEQSKPQGQPGLQVDMELSLGDVQLETVKKLQDLSFFTATFLFRELRVERKQLLQNKHTKLSISHQGKSFDILAFNHPEPFYQIEVGDSIEVVGGMNINEWRSRFSIQVMAKDFRCLDTQVIDLRDDPAWDQQMDWNHEDVLIVDDEMILERKLKPHHTFIVKPPVQDPSKGSFIGKVFLGKTYRMMEQLGPLSIETFNQQFQIGLVRSEIALKILEELGLLTYHNHMYAAVVTREKRDLRNAPTYVEYLDLCTQIERLYTANTNELKHIIHHILGGSS
jgi:single-stranded-DNA-specific exonuclease